MARGAILAKFTGARKAPAGGFRTPLTANSALDEGFRRSALPGFPNKHQQPGWSIVLFATC